MCRRGGDRGVGDAISDVRQAAERLNQIRGAEFVEAAEQGGLSVSLPGQMMSSGIVSARKVILKITPTQTPRSDLGSDNL